MANYYSYSAPILSPQWKKKQHEKVAQYIKSPVPKPKRSYPISKSKSQKWIEAEPDPQKRQIRTDFVHAIIHISFTQFLKGVCACTCAFKSFTQNRDWVLHLCTQNQYVPHKSSEWVANLMVEECKLKPPISVFVSLAFPDMFELWQMCTLYHKQTGSLLSFVFIDDVSYSGTQISISLNWFIGAMKSCFSKLSPEQQALGFPIHIHMLIPFIASRQLNKFGRLFSDLPNECQSIDSKMTCDGQVYTIDTVLAPHVPGVARSLFNSIETPKIAVPFTLYTTEVYDDFESHNPSLTDIGDEKFGHKSRVYTDHKLPDEWSIPDMLFLPLIDGCETNSGPCPPPPYKP